MIRLSSGDALASSLWRTEDQRRTAADLLGREFGILAEQKRLIQRHLDLKEEMHLRHNKEIENAFISETRLARGVEQDLLGDCKKAVLVQQDQSGKEEESHQCLRQLQDVNGEQLVGVPKLVSLESIELPVMLNRRVISMNC